MRFLPVIVSCLLFVGCKDASKDFEALADKACECATDDLACGTKVLTEVTKFAESHNMSDGDMKRFNEAGQRINSCLGSAGILPDQLSAALGKMGR